MHCNTKARTLENTKMPAVAKQLATAEVSAKAGTSGADGIPAKINTVLFVNNNDDCSSGNTSNSRTPDLLFSSRESSVSSCASLSLRPVHWNSVQQLIYATTRMCCVAG